MTWKRLRNEIDAHIEEKAQELIDAGVPEAEAWQRARREFGNATALTEASRDVWIWTWLERFWQDLVYARRVLCKHPGFTAIAVLSLALGVGANAAMFSLADALLLRPLPVPDPGGVVLAGSRSPNQQFESLRMSYPDYRDYRARNQSFDDLAAFTFTRVRFAARANELPEVRAGLLASGDFFQTMRVAPELGRVFLPQEDEVAGRDAVMVLSHGFWQQRFAGDPSVLGRTVLLNGSEFTIVGVLPAEFTGADQWVQPELYVPLMMWPRLIAGGGSPLEQRDLRSLDVKGRLKDGVSIEQARAEAEVIGAALAREYPETNRNYSMSVNTELGERTAESPTQAALVAMMLLLAGAVLLVACANVAGLLTSRAPARAREMSIRLATGAARGRIVRQLLTESFVLALLGAAGGVAFGYAGVQFLKQIQVVSDIPIGLSFRLDERALLFALAAALASVFLFGLIPALRTARADLTDTLRGPGSLSPPRRTWTRNTLVAAQVAASMVLLTIATFMYLTFQRELLAGPGHRTDHILVAAFDPGMLGYTEQQTSALYRSLVDRAGAIPGVRSAALASTMVGGYNNETMEIVPEGVDLPDGLETLSVLANRVDEHFAAAMRLPFVRGRAFAATDDSGAPFVAIVNEAAAARYWPGESALGKRIRLGGEGPWMEVVGVVETGKYTWLGEPPLPFLYVPYAQHPNTRMTMVLETAGAPASLAAPLREMVRSLDPNLPVFAIQTLQEQFEAALVKGNLLIIEAVAVMGGMGVLLSLTGIYGLMAFNVSARQREFGIRLAIGARRGNVLAMMLRQGFVLAASGTALGLLLSIGAARLLSAGFPGNEHPAIAYLMVAPSVFGVSILAALVPAARAARVDPASALRQE